LGFACFAHSLPALGDDIKSSQDRPREISNEDINMLSDAANKGDPAAQSILARIYHRGLGVEQDRQKAFELYRKAADIGFAPAQLGLAEMYETGELGKPDLVQSLMWLLIARQKIGQEKLADWFNDLKAKMTSADIETAHRLAEKQQARNRNPDNCLSPIEFYSSSSCSSNSFILE
jgi:TPR repeat protein